MLGLYIHIPFCAHICSYCDFPKRIPFSQEEVNKYIATLIEEIKNYKAYFVNIDTIYIGGGTPNYLDLDNLEKLLSFISSLKINFKEFSIELNPELITLEQVRLFAKYKINRVSLGMQTTDKKGLELLNRHHKLEDVLNAVKMLKDNGITNINIDLIYGYFNQTLNAVKKDIAFIKELDIKHISAYSLILENETLLNRTHNISELNEDLIADMNIYISNELAKLGFIQYEISNYAKPGFKSIHNLKYWSKEEYIGVGMGACSYLGHKRITNAKFLYKYLNNLDKEIEYLSIEDEKKEYLILGLRKVDGIIKKDYFKRFNSYVNNDFNYQKLVDYKLLYEDELTLRLTNKGLMLANVVFEEFI